MIRPIVLLFASFSITEKMKRNTYMGISAIIDRGTALETRSSLPWTMDKLIQNASMFHGHLGPFLVLGLKAGLAAVETLGRDPFKTRAIVETCLSPPRSCFLDGVQYASGCTLGKGNIEVRESSCISVLFIKAGKQLKLTLRDEVLARIGIDMSSEELEKLALDLSSRGYEELFEIKTCGITPSEPDE